MQLDWNIVATIAAPIIALFIGAALNRVIENRPKVISYMGHVSGIFLRQYENPFQVNTHSIVLINTGRKKDTNLRIGHNVLPDFQIHPDIEYSINDLPGGGKEILIPNFVPKKQVTVSYLYFPPLTWDQINTHLESDNGPLKTLRVLPTRQYPKWMNRIFLFILGYGVVGVVYTIYSLIIWIIK